MSLQPLDAAAEAFERLRSEVALLRRAVEGLATQVGDAPVDYSPTLAELCEAIAEVSAQTGALGERPLLALAPDQLASLLQTAAARILAKPLAELEQQRASLRQATEALCAASKSHGAKTKSWRGAASLLGLGALSGILVVSLVAGPLARSLRSSWAVPERLASAILGLPMASAGERLLARSGEQGAGAVAVARQVPAARLVALRDCLSHTRARRGATCVVKGPRP